MKTSSSQKTEGDSPVSLPTPDVVTADDATQDQQPSINENKPNSGLMAARAGVARLTAGSMRRWLGWAIQPPALAIAFLGVSAVYCFGVGRDRYQSTTEFVIRQPSSSGAISTSLLSPVLPSTTVLGSLEDGRFLKVYLSSPEVMHRLFPDPSRFQRLYAQRPSDPWSGLAKGTNRDQQLSFYQRQVQVIPQELSGSVQLITTGYTAAQALWMNQALLQQAQRFVNEVNQSISDNQRIFAEQEVARARLRLTKANAALNAFGDRSGQLDPVQERSVTTSYIAALEGRLVDLKVQEASLRRQFRDPQAPEVANVADQVVELERQIKDERRKVVSPAGRDLNKLSTQVQSLQNEVAYATEALKAAMLTADNRRAESERQLKFLVMLNQAELPAQPDSSWRWKAFLASIGALMVVWGVGGFLVKLVRRT